MENKFIENNIERFKPLLEDLTMLDEVKSVLGWLNLSKEAYVKTFYRLFDIWIYIAECMTEQNLDYMDREEMLKFVSNHITRGGKI